MFTLLFIQITLVVFYFALTFIVDNPLVLKLIRKINIKDKTLSNKKSIESKSDDEVGLQKNIKNGKDKVILSFNNVSKDFGTFKAVDALNLNLYEN